jgi:hypothetical protein
MTTVSDPIVEKMVQLHEKLEAASKEGSLVEGWRPLRLDSKGWVVAGRNVADEYQIQQFYPTGEWEKARQYLEIQNELRKLLFSDLTPEQLNAYRTATGLQPSGDLSA